MTQAFSPETLTEAVRILEDATLAAVPIAGGTDLMVTAAVAEQLPAAVVDVSRLTELQGIRLTAAGELDIGAGCTFDEIRGDALVRQRSPVLAEMAATIGSWQIRNRATLGGNIANASPAGDALPVLLALDATVVIAGPDGERLLSYDAMHVDYRRTALARGELIMRLRVPVRPADGVQLYRKVGTRRAAAISKLVVAGVARRSADGRLDAVRFGAGSVAPVPVRLRAVEELCAGRRPDARLAAQAAAAARDAVQPIDDVRSTAAYRAFVLGRVVSRMVLTMAAGAGGDPR